MPPEHCQQGELGRARSLWADAFRRLIRNPGSVTGAVILSVLILAAILCALCHPLRSHRDRCLRAAEASQRPVLVWYGLVWPGYLYPARLWQPHLAADGHRLGDHCRLTGCDQWAAIRILRRSHRHPRHAPGGHHPGLSRDPAGAGYHCRTGSQPVQCHGGGGHLGCSDLCPGDAGHGAEDQRPMYSSRPPSASVVAPSASFRAIFCPTSWVPSSWWPPWA